MTTLVLIVLAVVWACVLIPPWLRQRRGAFDARTTWFESPENRVEFEMMTCDECSRFSA